MSEDHPSKPTDSLTKATLDDYGKQGMAPSLASISQITQATLPIICTIGTISQ